MITLAIAKNIISPSRTYVAICNKTNFNGHYFKKFVLPKNVENNAESAAIYFVQELNFTACIDGCYSWENFKDLTTQE